MIGGNIKGNKTSYPTDPEGGKEQVPVSLQHSALFTQTPQDPVLQEVATFPKHGIHPFSLLLHFKLLTIKPHDNVAPLDLQMILSLLRWIFYCHEENHNYLINAFYRREQIQRTEFSVQFLYDSSGH